ncbi:MAG TPA: endonuclease domain-containing protein [Allosphingosinicella sp.]|jgi:very-short-patch-repair endonuclease
MKSKRLTPVARKLRRASTDAETHLWHHLRGRRLHGYKFRRQHPIGPHVVADFACEEARLIIELDGGQHSESPADAVRTATIEATGYHVLRFWNHDVLQNTDGVLEVIAQSLRLATGR